MKTVAHPKILVYVFAIVLALQFLTGCMFQPPQKFFLSSNFNFDTAPEALQIHQHFSENTLPDQCPQWFGENLNDIIYNLETVETIKGEILSIDSVAGNIILQVKTDNETIPAHLAPA